MNAKPRLVNLTPHAIVLQTAEGERITLPPPPKGEEARVSATPGPVEERLYPHGDGGYIPVHGPSVYGAIQGLPEPVEGTLYVVSLMVAERATGRTDVVAPATGPLDGAIRHAEGSQKGQIAAVTRLVRG